MNLATVEMQSISCGEHREMTCSNSKRSNTDMAHNNKMKHIKSP